jgi:hypothetical protein
MKGIEGVNVAEESDHEQAHRHANGKAHHVDRAKKLVAGHTSDGRLEVIGKQNEMIHSFKYLRFLNCV